MLLRICDFENSDNMYSMYIIYMVYIMINEVSCFVFANR